MTRHVTFQTKARTIDHLGREQIADCPTAISELWKNAYDAYAKEVSLHIFDGEIPVAALLDDGHGMNREEFESKWLTVGTESKTNGFFPQKTDRNGLSERPKQGQKGIGRLSSAALGPLLLLISKRENQDYVAALIDWRLFENPFLYLNDIRIPVREFSDKHEIAEVLPLLFDQMMGNIWGEPDDSSRNIRLNEAWQAFSKQEKLDGLEHSTQQRIEQTLISDVFRENQFNQWSVWAGTSSHGTAMFIADIQYDLAIQLSTLPLMQADDTEKSSRDRFFQTLSNFTDPFTDVNENRVKDFSYKVISWQGVIAREIISPTREFDLRDLEDLEHIIDGHVDTEGYFRGRVKVFGNWIEDYVIKPKQDYKTRKDSAFGEFHLRIGTFEVEYKSSSLNAVQHAHFKEQSERYGGFRVYRDGLRVMPYGRVDSDYFSIEERRSKNAGRSFWSNRRMFGRVAISRKDNPNLKDKAGREGFIENRASKLFREIVEKILIDSAESLFGSKAKDRKTIIEDIQEQKEKLKAEEDRTKLLTKERKRIRTAMKKNINDLTLMVSNLYDFQSNLASRIRLNSLEELHALKIATDNYAETIQTYSLSPVPTNLGRLEDDYRAYRKEELRCKDIIREITIAINEAITESTQKTDFEKAQEVYRSKLSAINNSITRYFSLGKAMLSRQQGEFDRLVRECREQYKISMKDMLEDLKLSKVSLASVLNRLDSEQQRIDIENAQKLSPYVTALERINEQIDLENLAIHSMNETTRHRDEVERLHSLAQLGITVEIIGHELEGLDQELNHSLKAIQKHPLQPAQSQHVKQAIQTQKMLMEKLRFLSPLKVSGKKEITNISGNDIEKYIKSYFSTQLATTNIQLIFSSSFRKLNLLEFPSRIYPVFINLVNNAIFWVKKTTNSQPTITFDCKGCDVWISDNGPGVDRDDLSNLFTLFFTRRLKGGRGIGLYLCKQNLMAGGHTIRYQSQSMHGEPNGAHFVMTFKGLKND
ncbi:ATP-binding protein [Tatumella sp. JGM118]|uniref:ATP-binding protein n=1 Tax=Tatumella sp. JGM118 TaxID=2799796 RepID=UPI001BAFCC9A|nr:ATP-binding protein [Tatumella sp. JGM118]MBS0908063.1 ATP-binding protein [Tatumella sp. JGM118]